MGANGRPPRSELVKLQARYLYLMIKCASEAGATLAQVYIEPTDYLLSAKYGKDKPVSGADRTKILENLRKNATSITDPGFLPRVERDFPGVTAIYNSPIWRFLENPQPDINECQALIAECAEILELDKVVSGSRISLKKFRWLTRLTKYEFAYFEKLYKLLIDVNGYKKPVRNPVDMINRAVKRFALTVLYGAIYREAYLSHNLRVALAIQEMIRDSYLWIEEFDTGITDIEIRKANEPPATTKRRAKRQARWATLLSNPKLANVVTSINDMIEKAIFDGAADMKIVPGKHLKLVRKAMVIKRNSPLTRWLTIHYDYLWGDKKY